MPFSEKGDLLMKRLVGLALLLTPLVAALWAAPVGATLPPGQWALRPGATVNFTKMDINSCNVDFTFFVIFDLNGTQIDNGNLGTNNGHTCSDTLLGPDSYTNRSAQTQIVKLRLDDTSCGASIYDSDGSGDANHATVSGKLASINDAGFTCQFGHSTSRPPKEQGNFNATLIFK